MYRLLGAGAAGLLTVSVLAGCGGGSSDSGGGYCGDVKAASTELSGLGGSDFTGAKFSAAVAAVHTIEAEAPSDIKPQWTIVASQFDSLTHALDSAGISLDEYSQLAAGSTPSGIDASKLTALGNALKSFNAKDLSAATDKIQAQVKSDCNIDLGSSN